MKQRQSFAEKHFYDMLCAAWRIFQLLRITQEKRTAAEVSYAVTMTAKAMHNAAHATASRKQLGGNTDWKESERHWLAWFAHALNIQVENPYRFAYNEEQHKIDVTIYEG